MGNRGILHDADRQLGRARWKLRAWLICLTAFGGRQRRVMAPNRYTELFFLDEATALAAGHRPCFECRRRAFLDYRAAWAAGTGWTGAAPPRVVDMDACLHRERVDATSRAKRTWTTRLGGLPDGTMVAVAGEPLLVLGDRLLPWRFEGYGAARPRPDLPAVDVLTPPSSVAAIAAGYRPVIHASAYPNAPPETAVR